MLEKIKRLGTDTAVYGISTILGRFLTFLLTPLYTHALSREDLGIVATVYAYIAFLNVVYGYGMEGAYMKYASTLEIGNRRQVFTIPFLAVGITSLFFSALLMFWSPAIADWINVPDALAGIVAQGAMILFLDALTLIPFVSLRMAAQARTFAFIKVAGILVNVLCNILFLFVFRAGVEGIFLSNIISAVLVLILLIPTILRGLSFSWPEGLLGALLRFGLPSVPAGIAGMMIQVINRPILESLSGKAAVGVFQANYRLGIFMMLLVSMFDFAWRPFFLQHAKDPDARPLFARVMTYVVLALTVVFLSLSFFLEPFVRWQIFAGRSLIAPPFWEGLDIVPVILLAYLFLGVYNNLIAGIYIEKRTARLPAVTFVAAAVNVVANYLLIPPYGLLGAAYATLASYLVMTAMMYAMVRNVYPVPYEWIRLAKITGAAIVVFGLMKVVDAGPWTLGWRGFLLLCFPGLLYVLRFFVSGELPGVARLLRAVRPGGVHTTPPPNGEA
jgi:O-antigen/teichoic acid export membrane protein